VKFNDIEESSFSNKILIFTNWNICYWTVLTDIL
jgi:hypothetical protein